MRCLALAEALRERRAIPRFVCRMHEGNLAGLLEQQGMPVAALPAPQPPFASRDGYAAWLGATEDVDAAETIAALDGHRLDWVVVDHYGIGSRWEQALRPHAPKLLAIDDMADRAHDCDVLLDQNHSKRGPERYRARVPGSCRLLLGPRYALLRAEFAAARRARAARPGLPRRVFIFMGGSDPANVTGLVLDALAAEEFRELEAHIVVGANNRHRDTLGRQAASRPRTILDGPSRNLAAHMAQADLAIGGGGVTTWERLCVGVPSLVVSIADNQVPACESLAADGFVTYLGPHDRLRADDIRAAIRESLRSPGMLAERSLRGQTLVDGHGAARVAELLQPTASKDLTLRPARADDCLLYFDWVNEPETRRQSHRMAPVALDGHHRWFDAKLKSAESRLFVMEATGLPVGQIRFERDPDGIDVGYAIDRDFRGRGWAGRLVALGLEAIGEPGRAAVRASVKDSNPASLAVFRALGFAESASASDPGVRVFRSPAHAD